MPTGAIPYFETPQEFFVRYDFFAEAAVGIQYSTCMIRDPRADGFALRPVVGLMLVRGAASSPKGRKKPGARWLRKRGII